MGAGAARVGAIAGRSRPGCQRRRAARDWTLDVRRARRREVHLALVPNFHSLDKITEARITKFTGEPAG